ncbi:phiSA1p31-related protein [Streptomyces achromogenes]|uniref:phiSA1p31-related protein n=1 Tax=Streptomyces achromogenes TaxID=67255 RepID=UPI0036FBAC93
MTFKAGDKVRVFDSKMGEVVYGPARSTFGSHTGYVVKVGGEDVWYKSHDLSAVPETPKFAVGDKARGAYSGVLYTIEAGPFHDNEYIWYATREPSGAVGHNSAADLKAVDPEPVKVGDRVRIVKDDPTYRTGDFVGVVGILREIEDDGRIMPYKVELPADAPETLYGRWWCAAVERVDAEDTYEHGGVAYDLSARYRDRDGDYWTFKRHNGQVLGEYATSNVDSSGCITEYSSSLAYVVRNYGPLTRVSN